jgi:hypothetical protein
MLDLDEAVLEVVAQWVLKAESDLKTAALLLRVRRDCPTDIVCFHVQQCVEKYLKRNMQSPPAILAITTPSRVKRHARPCRPHDASATRCAGACLKLSASDLACCCRRKYVQ